MDHCPAFKVGDIVRVMDTRDARALGVAINVAIANQRGIVREVLEPRADGVGRYLVLLRGWTRVLCFDGSELAGD